jgi:hypothetical protein
MFREMLVWVLESVWFATALAGFWLWERTDATPGTVRPPEQLTNRAVPGRWSVTVFAHPRCPCLRATLHEVASLSAPEFSTRVVFVRPARAPDGWERGEMWELAARIPGVEVACDERGAEARRVGAETSGYAVLTDPNGRVVFRGGLTRGRGRTGESAGRQAVAAWIAGRPGAGAAPVFGCPLFDSDEPGK